ncbi:MAG TPA: hypothetical protein VGC96_12490, partial [Candidatus Elarobacter sp.]
MAVLVDRRRVLQRIRRSSVPLIALVAPAGYGKSYIAHRIAREDPHWATVDAAAVRTTTAFLQALAALPFLAEHTGAGLSGLLDGWRSATEPVSLILENLENATDDGVLELISGLILTRPVQGKL